MCPDRRSSMCGRMALIVRTGPSRFVSSIHRQSLLFSFWGLPCRSTPAMLIRTSTWPMALIASPAMDRTEASLRTSVGSARAASDVPSWRISSTVRSMRDMSKSAMTSLAPCRASALAAVLPMPLAPPTTIATLPERAPRGSSRSSATAGILVVVRPASGAKCAELDESQLRLVVRRQQPGRERHQRDEEQERQHDPRVVAVGALELAQLRLLADPEDAEGQEAHEVGDQVRHQVDERRREAPRLPDVRGGGHGEGQHEQRHAHGEDAVGKGAQPFRVAAGDLVVVTAVLVNPAGALIHG